MDSTQLTVTPRERIHKGDNRKVRREGRVPAVIYGGGQDPVMVSVDNHEMELILRGVHRTSALFEIDLDGRREQTIIREIQRHPVTARLLHLDFMRIDMTKELDTVVSVQAVGATPVGVRAGGVLESLTRQVNVRCMPGAVPQAFEVDCSAMQINDTLHVSDIKVPEGVVIMDDPDTALFSVTPPSVEPVEEAAEEAAAEPEVIGRAEEGASEE